MIGLAIATPLSLILVTLSKNIPCLSWLDVLLGDSHPLPRSIAFYQRLFAENSHEVEMMHKVVEDMGAIDTLQGLILPALRRADQRDEAVASSRMLHKSGFKGWIVLGWWKSKSLRRSTRRQLKETGFDYVTHRMRSMDRMLHFAVESSAPNEDLIPDQDKPAVVSAV